MANKSIVKEYSLDRRFDFGEAKEKANPEKIVRFGELPDTYFLRS